MRALKGGKNKRAPGPNSQLGLFDDGQATSPREAPSFPGVARGVPPPAIAAPQVLHVLHQGFREKMLEPKMVGKVIPHPTFGLVFYHAQSGTQRHRNTDCPAPTDVCLIRFLKLLGIQYLYTFDREEGVLFRAKRLQIEGGRIEVTGNRKRHYLPEVYWEAIRGISERQEGRRRVLLRAREIEEEIIFVIPYLARPIVVLQEEIF